MNFPEGEDVRASPAFSKLPDEPEARAAVSAAQRAVVDMRTSLRKAYAAAREAIADATTTSLPNGSGMLGAFVSTCVQPRLQAVTASLGAAVRGYLASRYDPPEGNAESLLLVRAERERSSEIAGSAKLSAVDALRLRLADNGPRLMYALKLLRFLGQLAALWAAQRAYVEAYNSAVLATVNTGGGGGATTAAQHPPEPPDLSLVLFVFLGIDATLQLFVLMFLVVLAQLVGGPSFVIDDDFLASFLADYFVTTVAVGALGLLVAKLMKQKRYFDLANLGPRTAGAYCVVLGGASAVVGAVPSFLL